MTLYLWLMTKTHKLLAALATCTGAAVLTLWAEKLYWLGGSNFLLLCVFLVVHVTVSTLALWFIPDGTLFRIAVIGLLIVGQWWGIEFIAMLAIWWFRGFAP